MSREDNITFDWEEVNGVKYQEVPWDTPPNSPVNSPREMQQLATALAAALKKIEQLENAKKETPTNTIPQHQSSTETLKVEPPARAQSPPKKAARMRRVHGGL